MGQADDSIRPWTFTQAQFICVHGQINPSKWKKKSQLYRNIFWQKFGAWFFLSPPPPMREVSLSSLRQIKKKAEVYPLEAVHI